MSNANSTDANNQQSANTVTEAEKAAAESGVNPDKSSGNDKSNTKAGSNEGAGGGAKQQQKH